MAEWIIPTLIALPLVAATLPLISQHVKGNGGWSITTAVLGLEAALAAWLASAVYSGGRIIYQLGGAKLARPESFAVGIELMTDQVSALLILLTGFVSLAVLIYARQNKHSNAFYSGYLLLTGGLMGIFLTHDIFTLFVFLEITGLTTYALIASNQRKEAAVASLKYLIIGTVGASLYIIGVGYIYLTTGTLNMTDLAQVLAGNSFIEEPLYGNPLVQAGFGFMAVGLMVKSAIFPLHTWQPSAYNNAPDDVIAYISAMVSTAGAYALGRLIFTVYTPSFFAVNPIAAELVIGMAGVSIVAGSILAVMQNKVKRILAYSSVSQFGIIIAAFGVAAHPAGNPTALTGGIIHLFGHGLMKAGLFLTVGIIASKYNARTIKEYAGLSEKSRITAGTLGLLGIALIGVPPTLGFIGKWYIALGALKSGLWPIAALIIFSTMLTLLYIVKIIETAYFKEIPEKMTETVKSQPIMLSLGVTAVIAVLAIVLGFTGETLHEILKPFMEEVYQK